MEPLQRIYTLATNTLLAAFMPGKQKGPRRALPAPESGEASPMGATPYPPTDYTAVLSATAGLTAGFGMGPGDPRLHGRAHGGCSPWDLYGPGRPGALAAA